jgi:hypothetical protein
MDLILRYRSNIELIRNYLKQDLGCNEIEESEDFARDGVVLRSPPSAAPPFRLFVSHEFLSDFELKDAASKLRLWKVAEQLRSLPKNVMLFVTTEGTFTESLKGPTMKQATQVFESVFPSSAAQKELYGRVFSIRVDGTPLGEIPAEMRGDPNFYISYSDDFANVLGATYLLDAAGYREFELHRRPQSDPPEFEVSFQSGDRIFLAFDRALDPVEQRVHSMREEINAGLRRALLASEDLQNAISGHFVQINIAKVPLSKKECNDVVLEIIRFVTTVDWASFPEHSLEHFDRAKFSLLAGLDALVYVTRGVTSLSVQEGAKTVDPYAPYRRISEIVRERSRALADVEVRPLWLGISLADTLLPPENVLDPRRIAPFDVNETPFDKLIVGSAGRANVYNKEHRLT